jgi:hypothetical protein
MIIDHIEFRYGLYKLYKIDKEQQIVVAVMTDCYYAG